MTNLTLTDLRTAAAIVREDDQFNAHTTQQLTRIADALEALADAQAAALQQFLRWHGYRVCDGDNPPGWLELIDPDEQRHLLVPDGIDPDHLTREQALQEAARIVAEREHTTPPSALLERTTAVSLMADNHSGADLTDAIARHFHITDAELGLPF